MVFVECLLIFVFLCFCRFVCGILNFVWCLGGLMCAFVADCLCFFLVFGGTREFQHLVALSTSQHSPWAVGALSGWCRKGLDLWPGCQRSHIPARAVLIYPRC